MTYNTNHVTIVLGHMLRSIEFAKVAARLGPDMLQHKEIGGTRVQCVVFLVIKKYLLQFEVLPDRAAMVAQIIKMIAKTGNSESDSILSAATSLLDEVEEVLEGSEPLAREVVKYIANVCISVPAFERAIRDAQTNKSITDLSSKLKELQEKESVFAEARVEDTVFGGVDPIISRVSTQIPWLDATFGGGVGLPRGLAVAILAGQGSGKTTFGIQLAVSQAVSKKQSHLILFEEGLSVSIKCRICACATGIPIQAIRNKYAELRDIKSAVIALAPEYQIPEELVRIKLDAVENNLKVTDCVKNPEIGLEEAFLRNKRYLDANPDLEYTYIDWAGILATAMMGRSAYKNQNKEQILSNIAATVANHAEVTGRVVAISQQMSVKDVNRGAFAIHNTYCAADCHMFTAPFKYSFAINPRDAKSKLTLFQAVKTRDDDPPPPLVLEMQGAIASFRDVSDTWVMERKRFVKKASKAIASNTIPQE